MDRGMTVKKQREDRKKNIKQEGRKNKGRIERKMTSSKAERTEEGQKEK